MSLANVDDITNNADTITDNIKDIKKNKNDVKGNLDHMAKVLSGAKLNFYLYLCL